VSGDAEPVKVAIHEADWTDAEWDKLTAYIVSKTRAERAAWETMGADKNQLAVVNPGLVLGPAPDTDAATSLDLVKMLLTGAYPAMPPISFPCVDVRDVAAVHVAAMTNADAGGRRLIAVSETLSLREMSVVLRTACPERARKIPKWTLPIAITRLAAMVDPNIRAVVPDLGVRPLPQGEYVTAMTGVSFRPAADSVGDSGRSLISLGAA
jgi:nucleoside-diphosphate-sugar epimerase